VKTDGDPRALLRSIAAAVNSVDPDMPLAGAKTVDEIIDESLAINRFSVCGVQVLAAWAFCLRRLAFTE
jgi:hypothetical protein